MKKINWGIIGCGDVTECKSGPAFNKVNNSALIAVMRRDGQKAKDYAIRHQVPRWYDNAYQLINDPGINAIYIATPPSSHEAYALAAINAGKPVYVEKPMALSYAAASHIVKAATLKNVKLVVAHYRREQPLFKKIKQLLADRVVGDTRIARLSFDKTPLTKEELMETKNAWRVDPAIAGGGLFHDLAPHQLDLMYHFFGPVQKVTGIASNQSRGNATDDMVAGNILFKNGIAFSGAWCFSAGLATDQCEIIGSSGTIKFSVFGSNIITVTTDNNSQTFSFELLQHVQLPMIEKTVQYFSGDGTNPCSGEEGVEVMRLMEEFVKR